MNDRELMQQALDALTVYDGTNWEGKRKRVLAALRERLTQPEQEPFCYHDGRNIVGKEFADHSDVFPLYAEPPVRRSLETEQKPVAWIVEFDDGHVETTTRPVSDWKRGMWESAGKRFTVKPLYTSPPANKPWVGLTKDEVDGWELPDRPTVFEFAKFIEAKIKEKNG